MKTKILNDVLLQRPPDILYHYTTQDGLLGIIKDKEIWTTHTQYLNDQREYIHALELLHEQIDRISGLTSNPKVESLLKEMDEGAYGLENMNVCVCSFSEDGDSLSQWRAYGGASSGYSIGFSGEFLGNIAENQDFYLTKCIYDPSEQHALIYALVQEVLEIYIEEEPWHYNPDSDIPIGISIGSYLHLYAPILKNMSFKDEREWRLISRPLSCRQDNFDFRKGNSMLIPYYKFKLFNEDIPFQVKEIIVGPTPHPKQAEIAVSSLLVSQGLRGVKMNIPVVSSSVPYRNW